ncbi:MAG: uncharacterized protein JWN87_3065 [Frankiales bacterium]|jgi:hypothetical protein|nr:uncharacterized protein [Frankiales bacterium]MCW2587238.1 uncharacterized protein [Frankiales bacterium]
MAVQDDVTTARDALRALERAVATVSGHYGDAVDARRLRLDLERVSQDLDLLCGRDSAPPPPAAPLQVIDDTTYPQDFWMDAEDEGLGGGR